MQGQAAVAGSGPIGAYLVGTLKGGDKMLGVGSRSVPDAEVVDDKAEDNVFGVVSPQPGRERNGAVAVWCQKRDELVVGETPGLWETVHSAPDFHVHVPIVE
jgi:hypothetical protein